MWYNSILLALFLLLTSLGFSQEIKLEEIMKGDGFVGYSPQQLEWTIDNATILFDWNPEQAVGSSKYSYQLASKTTKKVPFKQEEGYLHRPTLNYSDKQYAMHYYVNNGDLYKYNTATKTSFLVLSLQQSIDQVFRVNKTNHIYLLSNNNLYLWDDANGTYTQVSQFVQGAPKTDEKNSTFLTRQQTELFPYLTWQEQKKTWQKNQQSNRFFPKAIYYSEKENIQQVAIDPSGAYITYVRYTPADDKPTEYEAIITENGYTQKRFARPKVSDKEPASQLEIFDRLKDSSYVVSFAGLVDIRKKPEYLKQYGDSETLYKNNRALCIHTPVFNEDGKTALVDIRSFDNKDRWIVLLDLAKGTWKLLDHQHDEAWIGGPGISSWNEVDGTLGWISATNCYFQSEETGYSHLYQLDVNTLQKTALTSGNWEVHEVFLAKDKKSLYLIANKIHPGVRNGYQLNLQTKQLIPLFEGNFGIEWQLSPDGKTWAIRYSTSTQPWELYTAPNKTGATMTRVTKSTLPAFDQLKITAPSIVSIPTSDGQQSVARLYKGTKSNGAAVLFVHGAGYLQNAHHYWSYYQREMLFHQLLIAQGYTVLDVDYRASEGYGRKWRTDIYRHMGERDLLDYVDAKNYLVKELGIDANRVGIYGGSYGGFISLMAMLKTPDTFKCAAALRSVTDWAHYNHEYTSNILNYPSTDSIAYQRSSPIYFAEGLKGQLLMLHGMQDDNVQFQDIVRLNQRFIELGKTGYQLAVFPTEAHGFTYTPAWVDEYRRILELFETNLK